MTSVFIQSPVIFQWPFLLSASKSDSNAVWGGRDSHSGSGGTYEGCQYPRVSVATMVSHGVTYQELLCAEQSH